MKKIKSFNFLILVVSCLFLSACSTTYNNQALLGKQFISLSGNNLDKQPISVPSHFLGKKTILLLGYVQNSQFDIDRWLIGLDMRNITVPTYELPAIQGMFPRFFKTFIDDGMRSGIPKELWKGVVTIYQDGEKLQQFTGNTKPNNSRVILLDESGKIIFFHDRGFSVGALNELIKVI